jgi:putative flavoprotein involved in K+ transport
MRSGIGHNGRGWTRVAIVGAGPAGLAASARLAALGCEHVVLERGQVGWSWRMQRWDSFRLNTPRWVNRAAGEFLDGAPDSFATAGSLVAALECVAADLPVFEGVEVLRARRGANAWLLETWRGPVVAGEVVVASGFQNVPRRPWFADALPRRIRQLHVADYRRPDDLDDGVLVVGGAQSGVQIAEDLLEAGRRVYLSTSRVGRLPRRHRGRDAFEWLSEAGDLDLPRDEAEPSTIAATPPQVSGAWGGRTVSYQGLARRGVTLLGRAVGWNGHALELAPNLGENIRFADEAAHALRAGWDRLAARRTGGITPAPLDPADEPAEELYGLTGPRHLDLAGISTVIWATGFGPSIGWLPEGALDDSWHPRMPGLHVLGAPWLTHRASANLYGMAADAERLAIGLAEAAAA